MPTPLDRATNQRVSTSSYFFQAPTGDAPCICMFCTDVLQTAFMAIFSDISISLVTSHRSTKRLIDIRFASQHQLVPTSTFNKDRSPPYPSPLPFTPPKHHQSLPPILSPPPPPIIPQHHPPNHPNSTSPIPNLQNGKSIFPPTNDPTTGPLLRLRRNRHRRRRLEHLGRRPVPRPRPARRYDDCCSPFPALGDLCAFFVGVCVYADRGALGEVAKGRGGDADGHGLMMVCRT